MSSEPIIQSDALEKNQNNKGAKINLNRYKDPEGLSMAKINLGFWILSNRNKFASLFFFALFLFGTFSWAFLIFQLGAYAAFGIQENRDMTRDILNDKLPAFDFYSSRSAQPLQLLPVKTLASSEDKIDLIGQLKNPNSRHFARFDYSFIGSNNQVYGQGKGFVFPGETKNLLALGIEIQGRSGSFSLQLDNINYYRANEHVYGRWPDYLASRLNFDIFNIVLAPSDQTRLTEKLPLNSLSFDIKNNSAFNYWNVPMVISFYNYADLVSIGQYEINDFRSGEEKHISLTWPGRFRPITEVKIAPDLDITQKEVFKRFEAPVGEFR